MSRPVKGPSTLAELAADLGPDGQALLSATTVDELRRLLLAGGRRRTTCVDAVLLLRAHHTCASGALDTARLLLTDRRWDRLTSRLVGGLVGTDLLSQADLDALVLELMADQFLHYRLDDRWARDVLVVALPSRPVREGDAEDDAGDDESAQEHPGAARSGLTARRRIPPPLRRWAAARAVQRSLVPLAELVGLAEDLPARDAAEVVRGILDQLDSLPPHQAEPLLERAVTWPARSVRLSALQHLVTRGEVDRARQLADADSDVTVRDAFADRDQQGALF